MYLVSLTEKTCVKLQYELFGTGVRHYVLIKNYLNFWDDRDLENATKVSIYFMYVKTLTSRFRQVE